MDATLCEMSPDLDREAWKYGLQKYPAVVKPVPLKAFDKDFSFDSPRLKVKVFECSMLFSILT